MNTALLQNPLVNLRSSQWFGFTRMNTLAVEHLVCWRCCYTDLATPASQSYLRKTFGLFPLNLLEYQTLQSVKLNHNLTILYIGQHTNAFSCAFSVLSFKHHGCSSNASHSIRRCHRHFRPLGSSTDSPSCADFRPGSRTILSLSICITSV